MFESCASSSDYFGIYAESQQQNSAQTFLRDAQNDVTIDCMTKGGLLRVLRKNERQMTLEQLAARCGIDTGNLSRIERDLQDVSLDTLERILAALEVSTEDFFSRLSGRQNDDEINSSTYAMIPRLSLEAAAGNGFEVEDHNVKVINSLAFRKDWLRKKNLSPDHLELYTVSGESMAPYLQDGDMVMVEHDHRRQPRPDEVWVISQPAPLGVRVKRLFFRESGDLIIRSDNPDKIRFADEIVSVAHLAEVQLIGRVVWRAG